MWRCKWLNSLPILPSSMAALPMRLNMPSLVGVKEAPKLRPTIWRLAEKKLGQPGRSAGARQPHQYQHRTRRRAAAGGLNASPITAGPVLAGLMRGVIPITVNMVQRALPRQGARGSTWREIRHDRDGAYNTLIRVTVETAQGPRSVAGTLVR